MEKGLPEKEGFERTGEYPQPTYRVLAIALMIAILTIFLTRNALHPIFQLDGIHRYLAFLAMFGVLYPINLEIHEGVHFAVHELLGYNPEKTIPWHHAYGFVNTPGQFVEASHNIVNLLAPLVLLNFVYATLIVADLSWTVSLVGAVLFIDNSVGSAADLYGAYFDYKLPPGSLVYFPISGEKESHIYEPSD